MFYNYGRHLCCIPEGIHLLHESDILKEAREPFRNDDNIG